MTADEFTRKYGCRLSTSAAVALIRFSQTPEGRRFMDGAPLKPQFTEPHKANPRRNVEGSKRGLRPARMTLDWVDDDEA